MCTCTVFQIGTPSRHREVQCFKFEHILDTGKTSFKRCRYEVMQGEVSMSFSFWNVHCLFYPGNSSATSCSRCHK